MCNGVERQQHGVSPAGSIVAPSSNKESYVALAETYPFLNFIWLMILFFAFVIWFWILISVFSDIFRRRDIGGGMKAIWIIFVVLFWWLGVLIYLIVEHNGMAERSMEQLKASRRSRPSTSRPSRARRPPIRSLRRRAARQRRDHAGRVRRPQGEGARLGSPLLGVGAAPVAPRPGRNCDALGMAGTILIGFDDTEGAVAPSTARSPRPCRPATPSSSSQSSR